MDNLYDLKLFYNNIFFIKPKIIKKQYNEKIQKAIIPQKNIYDLFKIKLRDHRKARLMLHYHLRIQPSEIDEMNYIDFEYLLEDLQELLKEKYNAEKKQQDEQKSNMPDMNKQMKGMNNMQKNMKMPKMPKF